MLESKLELVLLVVSYTKRIMLIKKSIIVIFIILNSGIASGQIYNNFKTMDHVYKSWLLKKCDTLYYSEKISSDIISGTIKLIDSKRTFPLYSLYNGSEISPLIITRNEQQYLIAELSKLKDFSWPTSMFPKSKRVSLEYIKSLYPTTNNEVNDQQNDCATIYSFSKPIFIRNGTICLYIDQELYNNSSNLLFIQFYQIIKGNWEEYADVFMHTPGDSEKLQRIGNNDLQTEKSKPLLENTLPDQSLLTDTQIQKFSKNALKVFHSGTGDSIHLIFPSPSQGKRIVKYLGETNTFSYEMLGMYFLINSKNVLDSAKVLNIDWSKTKFIGVKKSTTIIKAKDWANEPLIITNINVMFNYNSRKFLLEFKGLYFIDNEVKTTGIGKIIEIKK